MLFNSISLVMFSVLFVFYVLDFVDGDYSSTNDQRIASPVSLYEHSVIILASVMYIVVSLGFFIYGYYVFRSASQDVEGLTSQRAFQRRHLLRKVGSITLFCMGCFIIRAALTMWSAFDPDINWVWWLDLVYYTCLEVIPLSVMLGAYVDKKSSSYLILNNKEPTPTSPLLPDR